MTVRRARASFRRHALARFLQPARCPLDAVAAWCRARESSARGDFEPEKMTVRRARAGFRRHALARFLQPARCPLDAVAARCRARESGDRRVPTTGW